MTPAAASHLAAPAPVARRPGRPSLRVVAPPATRRAPRAASLALYALGLAIGFLLVALVSSPTGEGVVATDLLLAAAAGATALGLARHARRARVAAGAPAPRRRVAAPAAELQRRAA